MRLRVRSRSNPSADAMELLMSCLDDGMVWWVGGLRTVHW